MKKFDKKTLTELADLFSQLSADIAAQKIRATVDLPKIVAELEAEAAAGSEAALMQLRTERDRLDIQPGVLLKLEQDLGAVAAEIAVRIKGIIRGIREDAREKLEALKLEMLADKKGIFGGDPIRAREAAQVVASNSELKRWLDGLPENVDAYGAPDAAARRIEAIRKAFDEGISLSKAFSQTAPPSATQPERPEEPPRLCALERKAARKAAAAQQRKELLVEMVDEAEPKPE